MNDAEHIGHIIYLRADGTTYCETCQEELE
jgi:hypothetical protein